MIDETEWRRVWDGVLEISEMFSEGAAFIGGVAVFAHAKDDAQTAHLAMFSHDGDFFISAADFSDLRDVEQVTANRRLSKYELVKNGVQFDVYHEREAGLRVSGSEILAHAETRYGVRVAAIEHLLPLKIAALVDRRGSAKGEKDEDDLIRLIDILGLRPIKTDLMAHLGMEDVALLRRVISGPSPLRLTAGNAHRARLVRDGLSVTADRIEAVIATPADAVDHGPALS